MNAFGLMSNASRLAARLEFEVRLTLSSFLTLWDSRMTTVRMSPILLALRSSISPWCVLRDDDLAKID